MQKKKYSNSKQDNPTTTLQNSTQHIAIKIKIIQIFSTKLKIISEDNQDSS